MKYFNPNNALYNGPLIYPNSELHRYLMYLYDTPYLNDFYASSEMVSKILSKLSQSPDTLSFAITVLKDHPYDIDRNCAVENAPPPLPHEVIHGSYCNIDNRINTLSPKDVEFFCTKLRNDIYDGYEYFRSSCRGLNDISIAVLYASANAVFVSEPFRAVFKEFLDQYVTPLTTHHYSLTNSTLEIIDMLIDRYEFCVIHPNYHDDLIYFRIMTLGDRQ